MDDLLNSHVIQNHLKEKRHSLEDINTFLAFFNLFPLKGGNRQYKTESGHSPRRGVMIFDTFKKTFFSHLHQTYNIAEIMKGVTDEEKPSNRILKDPMYVKAKLKKLDEFFKEKFANCWVSVRKAFLDLDTDHDGFVSVEDIIRYFGTDNEISFQDLKKLLQSKDSNKKGQLSYQDFSRWVGNSIHSVQGFYFRHDSIKNPQYEKSQKKYALKVGKYQEQCKKDLISQEDALKLILDKIQFQWKTIRKSFHDFSKDKTGGIDIEELRFYCNHWGIFITEDTLLKIYEQFDWDKDGKISYADFQKTVGCEIHPGEDLYFRQDQPSMLKMNTCKHEKCWQPTKQGKCFCYLHIKVNIDIANAYFMKIFKYLRRKWRPFIAEVKNNADTQDHNEIKIAVLIDILKKYNFTIKESDLEHLLDSFPGNDEGQRIFLNISNLYQMRQLYAVAQTYHKVTVADSDSADDAPVDLNGFTGDVLERIKQKLTHISENEILSILKNNQSIFVEVMRCIKCIDQDNNGYVTLTELDDILKIQYKDFQGRDLQPFIKKYRSIQNKILVDYKRFRDFIVNLFKGKEEYNALNDNSLTKIPALAGHSQITAALHKKRYSTFIESSPLLQREDTTPIQQHSFIEIGNSVKRDLNQRDKFEIKMSKSIIANPIESNQKKESQDQLQNKGAQRPPIKLLLEKLQARTRNKSDIGLQFSSANHSRIRGSEFDPHLRTNVVQVARPLDTEVLINTQLSNDEKRPPDANNTSTQELNENSIINYFKTNDKPRRQMTIDKYLSNSIALQRDTLKSLNKNKREESKYINSKIKSKNLRQLNESLPYVAQSRMLTGMVTQDKQFMHKTMTNFNQIRDQVRQRFQTLDQQDSSPQHQTTLNSALKQKENESALKIRSIRETQMTMDTRGDTYQIGNEVNNADDDEIETQLTETIKEFRKEMKDSEKKKNMDSLKRKSVQNCTVQKFCRTLQNFGLDVSQQVNSLNNNIIITDINKDHQDYRNRKMSS